MSRINDLLQNLDQEQVFNLIDQMDEEKKRDAIVEVMNRYLVPHAEEIQNRAEGEDPPSARVREYFHEELDESEKEDEFYNTLWEVVGTFAKVRDDPVEGLQELKALMRDPYTVEALFLLFENEEHIDPEYSAQLKEFASFHLKAVGVLSMPEMYSQEEIQQVLDEFDLDPAMVPQDHGYTVADDPTEE